MYEIYSNKECLFVSFLTTKNTITMKKFIFSPIFIIISIISGCSFDHKDNSDGEKHLTIPTENCDCCGTLFEHNSIHYKIITSNSVEVIQNTLHESITDNIVIPDTISYQGSTYKVVSIGSRAFEDCFNIKCFKIPSTITNIGDRAFWGCSALTSITIPDSVINIGEFAFYNCKSLKFIILPNCIKSIGKFAFMYTKWYNELPQGPIYINDILYDYKGKIPADMSLVIKEGTTHICEAALYGQSSLTTLNLPYSVKSIGLHAFNDTKWYYSQPDGAIYVNNILYDYKGKMPAYKTKFVVKEGTISICGGAFSTCESLKTITIPKSVADIGQFPFSSCTSLTKIQVKNGNPIYDSRNKCNAIIHTATNTLVAGCKNTIIPNTVTSIGEYAFASIFHLNSIIIPEGVTSIGAYAFMHCSSLSFVKLPKTLVCIGQGTFSFCESLKSIVVPNNVTCIEEYAFNYCTSLESISIPNSVNYIGPEAFRQCLSLKSIYYDGTISDWKKLNVDNIPFLCKVHCNDGTLGSIEYIMQKYQ